ncbi:MAG: PHP domain-containing protein [Phycisphaeraceae bacterium]
MNRSVIYLAIGLLSATLACSARGQAPRITLNPYEDVDWAQHERHYGNFHTHTTESDGRQTPADVIDAYHQIGHDVLALTDHDTVTWPWRDFGRDPEALGMIAVPGNELSRHHHTLSLFSEFETDIEDHEVAIQAVDERGGVSVLAHPGRYWQLEEGQVPNEVRDRYAKLFESYSSLVGMEVVNQEDRYPHDRALWDALLTELMPERPVWGMANDDSHRDAHIGRNRTVLLLDEFTDETVRAALEAGRYYFTKLAGHVEDVREHAQVPTIHRIKHDPDAGTLTAEATLAGKPVSTGAYAWISAGGRIVHLGPTLILATTDGLRGYVRLEIRGENGTAFTQPFGLESGDPPTNDQPE